MRAVAYFARHGETDANAAHEFRGPMDVDLNDNGRQQAKDLADYFKGRSFSAAFHSSKKRTKQTIDPILKKSARPKMKAKQVKDFDALNVGDLAGQPKNAENLQTIKYYQEHPGEKIPGGERLEDFRKRVDPKIMMAIRKGDEAGEPTISAVHSSVIHQVSHLLHGDHNKVKVRPGGVVGVFKTPDGYKAKALYREMSPSEEQHFGS